MQINIKPSKTLYVVYMIFVLNVYYSLFNTNYANQFSVLLAFIGCIYLLRKGSIEKAFIQDFNAFCIPMIVITLISVLTAKFVHHTTNISDINQSLVRCFLYIVAFIIAYYSTKIFGKETPKLLIISGLISYTTVFARYLNVVGINGLLHFMNNKVEGISLEVHNLTYCLGVFFLYYLISNKYSVKFKMRMCCILAIAIFFGNKRSLYVAFIITLGVYFLFHRFKSKRLTILRGIFVIYIFSAFTYLWAVKTGVFELMLNTYNINDMSRLKFWNYFSGVYEVSPLYWGRGISYTDNLMGTSAVMHDLKVSSATNIHNDILRTYIGWGCIPFLYYLINFFLLRIRKFIKDKNETSGWKYFAIASFYFFVNFFDNMLTAVDFNICFFIVFLLLTHDENYKEGHDGE